MDNIKTDYVTLWIADAFRNDKSDMENGLCVWDVPQENYFYKDKRNTNVSTKQLAKRTTKYMAQCSP